MGLRIGICGAGAFSRHFIPLFKAHPKVDQIILCDLDGEKLENGKIKYGVSETCSSLDELCESDADCIAIFTQNWLHGPQAVQALRAGKHVYSAVPSAITMDEIRKLVRAVEETGKIYMVGETSYYYPNAIYCRDRYAKGDFGHIVYAEGEYYHDFDHGLYDVFKWRGGKDWKKYAGAPPMYYPTHSVSMLVSVTGAYATQVSALGWVDRHPDGLFREDQNVWRNNFSNETALFRMSDGSIFRVNEFRRVGHPGTVGLSIYGTQSSYEEQSGFPGDTRKTQVWAEKDGEKNIRLNELLDASGINVQEEGGMEKVSSEDGTHLGVSQIHDISRLPREFQGMPNGHNGSHQFLVDDFVRACYEDKLPPNNVWDAAKYLVPGLIAHESALHEGKLLEIPDFGEPAVDR